MKNRTTFEFPYNCLWHPLPILPALEAPAATLAHFRHIAEEELGGLGSAGQSSKTNASRDAHNFINRWGLTWKVPLTYVGDSEENKYAYIRPYHFVEYLVRKAPELLMGGCVDLEMGRSHLKAFWKSYERYHPSHCLYHDHHQHRSFDNTFCFAIHGDEGRGLKKGNTTILMMESCIGVDTWYNMVAGKNAATCKECGAHGPATKRIRLNNPTASESNPAAFQSTNLKQHPFLSKFVLAALPNKETELVDSILNEITRDFHKMFTEGINIDGQLWFVGCTGMKGDLKWFQKVGGLNRSFNNQTGINQKMCHECQAGSSLHPFEDHSDFPGWHTTIYTERPYILRPIVCHIPFENTAGNGDPPHERFFRRDIFHNTKQGTYRIFVASCVLLLCKLKYFHSQNESNARDVVLTRAYSHFNLFCKTTKRTAALRSFSLTFFNSPTWNSFPWVNCKGSDTAHLMAWVHTMTVGFLNDPLAPDHSNILKYMSRAADAGRAVLRISYSHNLWMKKSCAAASYDAFHTFLKSFNACAFLAMHQFRYTGFGMTSKFHLLAHTKWEILSLLRDENCEWIPNVQLFGCESNEDMVGKMSRLIRRVSSRLASSRALQLYLIKCKSVHRRFKNNQKNNRLPTPAV